MDGSPLFLSSQRADRDLSRLPLGGDDYVQPRRTFSCVRTGQRLDLYRFAGTHLNLITYH